MTMKFLERIKGMVCSTTDDDRIAEIFARLRRIESISDDQKRLICDILYKGYSPERKRELDQDWKKAEQDYEKAEQDFRKIAIRIVAENHKIQRRLVKESEGLDNPSHSMD